MIENQTTSQVLMIRPAAFGANAQTAASNTFQRAVPAAAGIEAARRSVQSAALEEFDRLTETLTRAGVKVHVFEDGAEPQTPDAIFPNNWFSTHADGTAALYPMLAPNRRLERREDILQSLSRQAGFHISRVVDFTRHEAEEKFLEGTGSLVLDRVHRIAYACLSPRTDIEVLGDFAQRLDYEVVAFSAADRSGVPIYHTNVLMCVGDKFATICAAAIGEEERAEVLDTLRLTGHEIIELSMDQLYAFAGNMLELSTVTGGKAIALSAAAAAALTAAQRRRLEACSGPLLTADIPTIERCGGGSVRCMLAEIHLPRKLK